MGPGRFSGFVGIGALQARPVRRSSKALGHRRGGGKIARALHPINQLGDAGGPVKPTVENPGVAVLHGTLMSLQKWGPKKAGVEVNWFRRWVEAGVAGGRGGRFALGGAIRG